MAEELKATDTTPEIPEQPNTDDAPGAEAEAKAKTAEKLFTQADLDERINARLSRAKLDAAAAATKATEAAERKAAEEQGQWKELYEKTQAEAATERQARQALEMATLKDRVARAVGLPEKLAGRLQGEDEESLIADAKSIMAELPKPVAPNINSGAGGGTPLPASGRYGGMTKEELAATYGLNPKYLPS